MRSFLDFERESERAYAPRRAIWLELLASDDPEAAVVQDWCRKTGNTKGFPERLTTLAEVYNQNPAYPRDVSPCKEWEARLICIACWFFDFWELTPWETAPMEQRLNHSLRVATLARELANLLEENPRPLHPTALELFDEEHAVDIIRALPCSTAKALLAGTGYAHDWHPNDGWHTQYRRDDHDTTYYRSNPAGNLSARFLHPEPQRLPSMLRRLAELATGFAKEKKRDTRPTSGEPNARAFARHLADSFKRQFDRTPNHVIAACVCLRFPDMDPPPNEDTIRTWRRAR